MELRAPHAIRRGNRVYFTCARRANTAASAAFRGAGFSAGQFWRFKAIGSQFPCIRRRCFEMQPERKAGLQLSPLSPTRERSGRMAESVMQSLSPKTLPAHDRVSSVNTAAPGAVILGIEHQGLGLLRQLRAAGVRCVLVDQDRWGLARFSRHSARFHQCPPYESEDFWPWLAALGEREMLDGWLLIP